ncbi:N/A [soil metagenome]
MTQLQEPETQESSSEADAGNPPAIPNESPPMAPALATAICLVSGLAAWWLGPTSWPGLLAFVLAYVAGGIGPVREAIAALAKGQPSVDLLMILAALGAATIGEWVEGTILLFLFSLSGTLEQFAMYRTTRSIGSLIQLRPREASRVENAREVRVLIEDLSIGDLVRIRPGERFPVDGQVVDGETWADESTLTGESRPVHKRPGQAVFAGTINGQGSVLARMTKAVADTTLERIVRMVQEAQAEKTPTQRFVESWQRPYVLGVLTASALMYLGSVWVRGQSRDDAFYHAMVLLVAASPCAVVVSSPSVILSAIARAGRHGVLFKGGRYLETIGKVNIIAFDKTGTITLGRPAVDLVWTPGELVEDEARLLQFAAMVEHRSEHPLALTIVREAERRGLDFDQDQNGLSDFESHTGLGVHARAGGVWIGIGREELFESHRIAFPPEVLETARRHRETGKSALIVIVPAENLAGVIVVSDQLRPEAPAALALLKQLGVSRLVILTGDHDRVARAIAERVHADEVRSGLLPDQKVFEIRRLVKSGQVVAMVGDGVNDAPALAMAPVGIAMGGAGTDVALEVADVVLMRDDLTALPFAVWLGRRALKRVRQNMTFAFSMIALLILSTFFGLPLWLGVIGHEGSTLLVVLNGLRLLWERGGMPTLPVSVAEESSGN